MAYRQTNKELVTEDEFKELFDIQQNTFWKYKAYSWYDPQLIFKSADEMRDALWVWASDNATFWQKWWEDDTLIGFRMFCPCNTQEDFSGGIIHTASEDGPIGKIIGPDFKEKTMRTDIMIGRPDSTGSQKHWMETRPEIAPTWNNNDGQSLYQTMLDNGFERAYSCTHGMLQKQLLWGSKDCESLKHDIWLQHGYSFNERLQLGFDVNEQTSFIYRLVGGESMGWPSIHPLYHVDNIERPDKVERPYMETRDDPNMPPPAPIPPETIA